MLTKHYGEAIGFDIIFFLPDSEEDFASYTEFLQYLGLKNRVGVAKCDDGTTLFLVPPSDFLTKVLKVNGPKRLYGVVLKLPHQSTTEVQTPQAAPLPQPRYNKEQQEPASQDGYDYIPANEDMALRMDYGRGLHDNSISRAGVGHNNQDYPSRPVPHDYVRNPEATSQVEVSLTPELIATLASLLPSNSQSSTAGVNNIPLGSSVTSSSFPANGTVGPPVSTQGSIQERQVTYSASQVEPRSNTQQQIQQFGGQYNTQAPVMSQYPTYTNLSNGPDNSGQPARGGAQVHDHSSNLPQISATSTRHLDNYGPSHGQSLASINQHYQHDSSFHSYNARGTLQATDSMSMLNQPVQQQSAPAGSSSHGLTANMLQSHIGSSIDFSAQMQQVQVSLNRSGDCTSQEDAEKNQRYQSTLQFAASLLQRIQQQQQGNGQAAGGSGNQQ